jgi:predicted Zn-dependent peptidase
LLFDKVDTNVEIFEKIDAITSTEVQSIANEILVEDKFSSLTFI